LDEIATNKKVIDNVNIYANSKVRQGSTTLSTQEFIKFMNDKIQGEIDSLKSAEAIKRRESTRDEMVKYLNAKNKELDSVFSLHASLTEAKILLVRKLESVKSIGTFIQTDDGFKVTAPEGFVGIDKYTTNAVKLVDRLEFSKANFTVPKNWG
jgi:2-succinyl-5-enolpyruvyl-6-hydroxy-3-cyclohexene-1-carboxylate synthase